MTVEESNMSYERWRKELVVGILLLFIGMSLGPNITGMIRQYESGSDYDTMKAIRTMHSSDSSLDIVSMVTVANPSFQPDEVSTNAFMTTIHKQSREETILPTFDNIELSQPLNNDVRRAGDLIEITGSANGPAFHHYVVEWGNGENPSQWFTTGIQLINGGLIAIVNDTLATWDTGFVETIDFFTLRLTVNFTTYENDAFIRKVCLDPSLKAGWPQRIPFEYDSQGGFYYWPGYLEPVVDDIDNNGQKEIIVYTGGDPPKLCVFRSNGSLLWSAPVGTTDASGGNLHLPLVGDINKDGFDEIVVFRFILTGAYSQLYVFNHTGQILDGWPITIPKEYHPTLLIADVNNDGFDEIIFNGNDAVTRYLLIIDKTGTIIAQWTLSEKHWGSSIDSTPALGNFDNDPQLEIVCASPSENAGYNASSGEWNNEGVIHVYNIDGSELPGWPKYTDGVIFSSPATGDIDNDGDDDIIVGLQFSGNAPDYRYGGLYAFDKNGEVLPGWPVEKGWNFASSPALADFDGDGDLEIVASRLGFYTYVIHHDGTLASGWPQQTTWNDYYSPIIGDITNDNIPDILTTAGNGFYPSISSYGGVYAWEFDGTPIPGFPKPTEVDAQAPAHIGDIDDDGKIELIASSDWDYDYVTQDYKYRGSLYVWEIDATYVSSTMEWSTFHHDVQRTGMYPYVQPPLALEIGNITGGLFKVRVTITNIGTMAADNIEWNISVIGGLLLIGRQTLGNILSLNSSEEHIITSKTMIGVGKPVIKITATTQGITASKEQNALFLLFFIFLRDDQ
jgi:hypothetical protein